MMNDSEIHSAVAHRLTAIRAASATLKGKNHRRLKAYLLLAACCAQLPAAVFAADYITTVEDTPGLIGYWRFTPTTQANSSVNGYTGTFEGDAALGAPSTGPALADDPSNEPVVLDGTNNTFVNTDLVGGINQAGSIVGWFNLGALPSTAGHIFTIASESQTNNDFDLQINTDDTLNFYTNSGGSVQDTTAFTSASLDQWILFTATFASGGDATLYLNGAQVAQIGAGTHGNGDGTFSIGESDAYTGRFFEGALDEIAVYNTDLTPAQVTAIYNSVGVAPEPSSWAMMLGGAGLLALTLRRRFVRV
jgi:hypothetical protein